MHTTETDGKDDIRTIGDGGAGAGLDTSRSPITANRSRWPTASTSAGHRACRTHSVAVDPERLGIRLLAGNRVRHQTDGPSISPTSVLAALESWVASVHSAFTRNARR